MQTEIIKIGNSKGLRIPSAMLKQCNLVKEVNIEVENNKLIISASNKVRNDWEQYFKQMAVNKDDKLIDSDIPDNSWDEKEWQW